MNNLADLAALVLAEALGLNIFIMQRLFSINFSIVMLSLLVFSCSPQPPETFDPAATTTSISPQPTAAPATATKPPGVVYLQTTTEANHLSLVQLRPVLIQLAEASGLEFLEGGSNDPVPANARVIVTGGDGDSIPLLLTEYSDAVIIAIGDHQVQPEEGLLIIRSPALALDRAAFLAGYIGAALIPDHRTGIIQASGSPLTRGWPSAYRNGQKYYCGLCRAAYPPFTDYPVVAQLPAEYGQQEINLAIDELRQQGARSILLPPLGQDPNQWPTLTQDDLSVISIETPPQNVEFVDLVIRTAPEFVIQEYWSEVLAGTINSAVDLPITLENLNPDQISDARMRLAREVLSDLNSGFIRVGGEISAAQ